MVSNRTVFLGYAIFAYTALQDTEVGHAILRMQWFSYDNFVL